MFRSLITTVFAVASLTACSTDSPAPVTPVRDEAAFLKTIGATPASNTALLIEQGDKICALIGTAGVTHEGLVQAMTGSVWNAAQAEAFMVNSETHLCPDKRYAVPTVNNVAAPAPTAPVAVGPATPISARDWQLIAKDPASHAGQRVIVYGNVTQFDSGTGTSAFRANVDGVQHRVKYGYIDYQTNTMLTGDASALANVVQGDLFTAEATVSGPYTYATTIGGQMTAPMLTVTKLTVTGHIAH